VASSEAIPEATSIQGDGRFDKLVKVEVVDKARMLELWAKHHGAAQGASERGYEVVIFVEE